MGISTLVLDLGRLHRGSCTCIEYIVVADYLSEHHSIKEQNHSLWVSVARVWL